MSRCKFLLPLLAVAALVAGCGTSQHQIPAKASPSVVRLCPQAANGHGQMGGCTPKSLTLQTKVLNPFVFPSGARFPDLSNNDPTYDMGAIRRFGNQGVILKTNQGTGFIDSTFAGMAHAAKAVGLAVGGYDFDEVYTASEAYTFINRLHAAGIYRNTANTFPPTLDVEFGNFNREGLRHQIDILLREYGRVQIYTGAWYIEPHLGCAWPSGVPGWISGYPNASAPCGLPGFNFKEHQYTDRGFNGVFSSDMSIWRFSQSSFDAFVHKTTPPPPKPSKKAIEAKLHQERHYIVQIQNLLTRHRCRTIHGKRAYRACPVWAQHGQQAHKRAKAFESQLR